MYKRVLVAADGSPWSDAAVTYAITLAARIDAELRILTVLTTPAAYAIPDVMGSSDLVVESVEQQGQELLTQAAAQAMSAGVPHTTTYRWGNALEAILQTATEEGCDLITLGARMITGWKRLMIGSIANAVAAKAQQPVLMIKHPPPPASDQPLWRRALVATGGSPWSDAAVNHALTLAQTQRLEVCLLHVESKRRYADDPASREGKNVLALAEARAAAAGVSYEARLGYGRVAEVILETATERQCDVIILGSRGLTGWKRLMLGDISNAVAAKTALPVLLVKHFLFS